MLREKASPGRVETHKVNLCVILVRMSTKLTEATLVKNELYSTMCQSFAQLILILYDFNLQFEEEAKLVARFEVPGRPTCLTVIGRKTLPKRLETTTDETKMAVRSKKPLKAKKNKDNGKTGRATVRTSGSFV